MLSRIRISLFQSKILLFFSIFNSFYLHLNLTFSHTNNDSFLLSIISSSSPTFFYLNWYKARKCNIIGPEISNLELRKGSNLKDISSHFFLFNFYTFFGFLLYFPSFIFLYLLTLYYYFFLILYWYFLLVLYYFFLIFEMRCYSSCYFS